MPADIKSGAMNQGCIFIFCVAMQGHLTPLLPVMRAFVNKGFAVRVYSREWAAGQIEETGAVFVPAAEADTDMRFFRRDTFSSMISQARKMDGFFRQEIERWKPLFAVIDTATVWGRLIAEKYSLRVFLSSPTMVMNRYTRVGYFREYFNMVEKESDEIERVLEELAREGFPKKTLTSLFTVGEGEDCITYVSEAIQPFSYMPGKEHIFYVGCSPRTVRPSHRFPYRWRGGLRPRIYVTQGTISSVNPWFFRSCIEAFRSWDAEIVMTIWKYIDPAQLGDIPAHIHVLREGNQREILARSDVMLCHGGLNTVTDGLTMGVPMAVYPSLVDQYANAKRIEELGAGIQLKDCHAQTLFRAAWLLLSSPSCRERAQALGDGLLRPDGANMAAEWMLRRLES